MSDESSSRELMQAYMQADARYFTTWTGPEQPADVEPEALTSEALELLRRLSDEANAAQQAWRDDLHRRTTG
jgi:hypothetical protein